MTNTKILELFSLAMITTLSLLAHTEAVTSGGHLWLPAENGLENQFTMEPIGDRWVSPTRLDCAMDCHVKFDNCKSVMYEKSSGICTPGGRLINSTNANFTNAAFQFPQQNSSTHKLYYSDDAFLDHDDASSDDTVSGDASVESNDIALTCNLTTGFTLVTKNNKSVCYKVVSTEVKQYAHAKERCEEMDAVLYTMKYMEKYDVIFEFVIVPSNLWIGLEDTYQNGSFHWVDGELFEPNTPVWSRVWDLGQPEYMTEHCVVINPYSKRLHDLGCSVPNMFICEQV